MSFVANLIGRDWTEATLQRSHALSVEIAMQGHQLSDQLTHSTALESKLNQTLNRMDNIDNSLSQLRSMQQALLLILPSATERSSGSNQPSGGSSPSLPPSIEQSDYNVDDEESETSHLYSMFPMRCTCIAQSTQIHGSCHESNSYLQKYLHHARCPLSIHDRVSYEANGSLRMFNLLFKCQVGIRYSQRAVLRSFEVYRNFTIRAVVSSSNPAFQSITKTLERLSDSSVSHFTIREEFQRCLGTLEYTFLNGEAWPTDVEDICGENLLWVSTSFSCSNLS